MKAVVFLADGLEECEGLLTVDLLRRAGIAVTTASIMGKREIHSSHDIDFLADALAEELDYAAFDLAVLPGGGEGTANLKKSSLVADVCTAYAADETKWVAAVCAAPTVLGGLGLLRGRNATCFPGLEEQLTGAVHCGAPVEVSGHIITGRALGATIPFALEIIRQLLGDEKRTEIAERICFPL